MTTHWLKTIPSRFQEVWDGKKTVEIRYNDRNYRENDFLILADGQKELPTTLRAILAKVIGIMDSSAATECEVGLKEGFVALSLERIMNLSDGGDVGITPTVLMWADNARRNQALQQQQLALQNQQ